MKKVYCKHCRFRFGFNFCRYNPGNKSVEWLEPGGKTHVYDFCSGKNKNNDCPEYKRKRWKFWVK